MFDVIIIPISTDKVMTYRLNVCSLSSVFEKSFGLIYFTRDYKTLLFKLNNIVEDMHLDRAYGAVGSVLYKKQCKDYSLFCKLQHFFNDFNLFINTALSPKNTQSRYSKFGRPTDLGRGFTAFILRVKSMNILQVLKDSIEFFLTTELNNFLYKNVHKEENKSSNTIFEELRSVAENPEEWLLPSSLIKKSGFIFHGRPKRRVLVNKLQRANMILLEAQLSLTWQKFPELRLGQLISNSLPEGTDIFYVPDDKLIQLLKDFEVNYG